jgi:hypothetical protein
MKINVLKKKCLNWLSRSTDAGKMTIKIHELKKKSEKELAQLKKDGKIGWNEFLLSADDDFFTKPYIEWLAGHEQNDVNAKNFILSDDGILNVLEDYGLVTENEYLLGNTEFHFEYMAWLNGREPTEETAKEFNKIPLEDFPKIFAGYHVEY